MSYSVWQPLEPTVPLQSNLLPFLATLASHYRVVLSFVVLSWLLLVPPASDHRIRDSRHLTLLTQVTYLDVTSQLTCWRKIALT